MPKLNLNKINSKKPKKNQKWSNRKIGELITMKIWIFDVDNIFIMILWNIFDNNTTNN